MEKNKSKKNRSKSKPKNLKKKKGKEALKSGRKLKNKKDKHAEKNGKNALFNEKNVVFRKIDDLIRKIQTYPVISKDTDMLDAKMELINTYKQGNDNVKQSILYVLHNLLFEIDDIRQPQSTRIIKIREQINDDVKLRIATYQKMFNYNTSFEGIHEVINILTQLDDSSSAKVLTHFFSHILMLESEANRMLRNDIVHALGNMTNMYALKALLYYHSVVSYDKLENEINDALNKWKKKLGKLNISKQEKEIILRSMDNKLGGVIENPESQYR